MSKQFTFEIKENNALQVCRDYQTSLALFIELEDHYYLKEIKGCNPYLDYFLPNKEVAPNKDNMDANGT